MSSYSDLLERVPVQQIRIRVSREEGKHDWRYHELSWLQKAYLREASSQSVGRRMSKEQIPMPSHAPYYSLLLTQTILTSKPPYGKEE